MDDNEFEVSKKRRNFTIVDNALLKDKNISWQAKGIMAYLLSLPDTYVDNGVIKKWVVSRKNIINSGKNGETSVNNTICELRRNGYIVLCRYVNKLNKTLSWRYIVYEHRLKEPILDHKIINISEENPDLFNEVDNFKKPDWGFPDVAFPDVAYPHVENQHYINTNINNNNFINTQSINHDEMEETIKQNIGYDFLCSQEDENDINNIVKIMVDTICNPPKQINICGCTRSYEQVKNVLLSLNETHIQSVLSNYADLPSKPRNMKSYTLSCLFNSSMTSSLDISTEYACNNNAGKV